MIKNEIVDYDNFLLSDSKQGMFNNQQASDVVAAYRDLN